MKKTNFTYEEKVIYYLRNIFKILQELEISKRETWEGDEPKTQDFTETLTR